MLAVFLFPFFFGTAVASVGAIDDLYLTCRGNEMAPAICYGDTVRVRVCVNGTLIQAGPVNSTHPGDIIVYCAAAAVPMPQSMWMCGRAVRKYQKDGEWYFKTQMDNLSKPDAWEVPEHYLLGVVDDVMHGTSPQSYEPTSDASSQSSSGGDLPDPGLLALAVEFVMGTIIGAAIGVVAAKAYVAYNRTDSSGRVLGWFRSDIHHYAC
jgi:hypothetical protein